MKGLFVLCKGKVFLKLSALSMALALTASYSLCANAEPESEFDDEVSEQPVIQESVYDEESSEPSFEEESSEIYEDSDNEESEDDENSEIEESSEYEFSYEGEFSEDESSEFWEYSYYEESQHEYSENDRNYEPSVYYYGEPSYYEDESENSEYYEESSEPSKYKETSVDSSELTSGDWENLRKRLDAQMSNKSSDNAIRDIKEGDGSQNDSASYLVWGIVLIGAGLAIIGFIICTTVNAKRRLTKNLNKKYRKSGSKIKKF